MCIGIRAFISTCIYNSRVKKFFMHVGFVRLSVNVSDTVSFLFYSSFPLPCSHSASFCFSITLIFFLLIPSLSMLLSFHLVILSCSFFLPYLTPFVGTQSLPLSLILVKRASTYTAYSNEPRIVRCISGPNWILKIKKEE